jgi:hypothetical protein
MPRWQREMCLCSCRQEVARWVLVVQHMLYAAAAVC